MKVISGLVSNHTLVCEIVNITGLYSPSIRAGRVLYRLRLQSIHEYLKNFILQYKSFPLSRRRLEASVFTHRVI